MSTLADLLAPLTQQEVAWMLACRRALHAEPELSMAELDTQESLYRTLSALGFAEIERAAGTGLVVRLGQGGPGAVLLLRADMDALPILEQTDLDFASRRPGVMHACGHDTHMAMLLAVARRLRSHEDAIPGTVVLCFQPGEEIGRGAKAMIQSGLLTTPPVTHALALHVWSGLPTGAVSAASGPIMAAVDEFEIQVQGRGGHGAMPHTAADAVVAAATVVQALQTVVSRQTDPLDPVVVTVGSIHGGTAFNVIAESVTLLGTVRSFSKDLGDRLPKLVSATAAAAAAVHGATTTTRYDRHTIALHNDPAMAQLVAEAAAATPGVTHVDRELRLMAGEDMAYFLDRVPGCFFFIGCGGPNGQAEPHHSPRFVVDEAALPIGASVMLHAVVKYFRRAQPGAAAS